MLVAGFKKTDGRLIRSFVEADYSDIKACNKCSNCKNHNARAMKKCVDKEVRRRGYFECHALHDKLDAKV